jgi:hypothetical protein
MMKSCALRIPASIAIHAYVAPSLLDRLNVRRLSEAVVTKLARPRHAKGSLVLTWRFRAALRWLQKFCVLQEGGSFVDYGRLDVFVEHLKVYEEVGTGKNKLMVTSTVEVLAQGRNIIFQNSYLAHFLWIKATQTLVVPKVFDFLDICHVVCASVGSSELRMLLKMQKAGLFDSRMLDEEVVRFGSPIVHFGGSADFLPEFVASDPPSRQSIKTKESRRSCCTSSGSLSFNSLYHSGASSNTHGRR